MPIDDPFAQIRRTLSGLQAEEAQETEGTEAPFDLGGPAPPPGQVAMVAIERIDPPPYQSRIPLDTEQERRSVEELARNIEAVGLIHPIVVRPAEGGRYQLVAGSRRLEAFRLLGRDRIPAYVVPLDEQAAVIANIAENTIRRDLDALSRAEAAMHLLMRALNAEREEVLRRVTQAANYRKGGRREPPEDYQEIAEVLGNAGLSADAFIRQHAPVLRLPEPIVNALRSRLIGFAAARAIAKTLTPEQIDAVARYIRENAGQREAILAYIQTMLEQAQASRLTRDRVASRLRAVVRRLPQRPDLLEELLPLVERLEAAIEDLHRKARAKRPSA